MSRKHQKIKAGQVRSNPGKVEFPKIDVVIPVYGQFSTLAQGLANLDSAMGGIPYRTYLTDDFSPDLKPAGESFYAQIRGKVDIQYHKTNMGFGKSCNDAAMRGTSKYILVHSTDVILFDDSVRIMYEQLENNPDIAIAAPMLLFFPNSNDPVRPANKVQSVGLFFDAEGMPYHPFVGWDNDHPLVNMVRDVNAVTGAVFLIRRKVWEALKGFSLDYGRGTWEDVDLSVRVRAGGSRIRILPQARGYHFTNLSVLDGKTGGFPINHNQEIFRAKFSAIVPYDAWWLSGPLSDE